MFYISDREISHKFSDKIMGEMSGVSKQKSQARHHPYPLYKNCKTKLSGKCLLLPGVMAHGPSTRELRRQGSPEFDTSQAYSYIVRTCLQNKRKKMCILYLYYLNVYSS